jgi:hemerythrin-like domain-containing protein
LTTLRKVTALLHFDPPAAGFDDPLALWLACHQRVQRFSRLLPRLSRHLATRGADDEAQQAANAVRRYFNEAAPRHHDDEELDLFPRLADADGPIQAAVERLEGEHRGIGTLWRSLDRALADVGQGAAVELPDDLVAAFGAAYDAHIALEEGVLLPAMRSRFTTADWRAIGAAMAERRGILGAGPLA